VPDERQPIEPNSQGDQKIRKIHQIFQKITQKVAKSKKNQNMYNKAQFESPKHVRQTTFETLKYLQQTILWNCLLSQKNLINLHKQKVAIILGYLIL
jgi:hypothetical protein